MDDGVESAKLRSPAGKVMSQAAVGGMGSGRTAGQTRDMMPTRAQIAPHAPHEPVCASHQDFHAASNKAPVAERKDRVSKPPVRLAFRVWGGRVWALWHVDPCQLLCCPPSEGRSFRRSLSISRHRFSERLPGSSQWPVSESNQNSRRPPRSAAMGKSVPMMPRIVARGGKRSLAWVSATVSLWCKQPLTGAITLPAARSNPGGTVGLRLSLMNFAGREGSTGLLPGTGVFDSN